MILSAKYCQSWLMQEFRLVVKLEIERGRRHSLPTESLYFCRDAAR